MTQMNDQPNSHPKPRKKSNPWLNRDSDAQEKLKQNASFIINSLKQGKTLCVVCEKVGLKIGVTSLWLKEQGLSVSKLRAQHRQSSEGLLSKESQAIIQQLAGLMGRSQNDVANEAISFFLKHKQAEATQLLKI